MYASYKDMFQFNWKKTDKRKKGNNGSSRGNNNAISKDIDQRFNFDNLRISQADEIRQKSHSGHISMVDAIKQGRYDVVHLHLQSRTCSSDPNEEIKFDTVYMTGLEYSIYGGDWKMAILFFINSADPAYNCFDGTILKHSRRLGRYVHSHSHPAFMESNRRGRDGNHNRRKKCNRIPGFEGLYCLANSKKCDKEKVLSSLWLMRRAYENEKSPPRPMMDTVSLTREHICNIGCHDIWNSSFCDIIYTCLLCLRYCFGNRRSQYSSSPRAKLPNDISIHILEYIMDDVLCDAIQEVLRGITFNAITATTT